MIETMIHRLRHGVNKEGLISTIVSTRVPFFRPRSNPTRWNRLTRFLVNHNIHDQYRLTLAGVREFCGETQQ